MTNDRNNMSIAQRTSTSLYVIGCVNESYRLVSYTAYYPSGRNETVRGDGETTYAVPGSIMGSVVEAYCADPTPSRRPTSHS